MFVWCPGVPSKTSHYICSCLLSFSDFVLVTSTVLGGTQWSEISRISAGIAGCFPQIRLGFCVLWGGDGGPSPPRCRGGAPRTTHRCWCWTTHLVEACWSLLCISCGLSSLEGIPLCSPHSGVRNYTPPLTRLEGCTQCLMFWKGENCPSSTIFKFILSFIFVSMGLQLFNLYFGYDPIT